MKQHFKTTITVSLLCLSLFIAPVQAATGVGKAIISIGKVFTTSKDGKEKKLKRRGKVFEGDTITVGKKSRLQLRFIDNQLVVLKENTVFRIDEYKFKDKNDNHKSAALSLLKGGMRSVTGLIGKSARDKYKVRTPVATMGVRGTHYIIQICSGNCGDGVQGIVGTVLEGEIEMINDGGSVVFGIDQFFNVASLTSLPVPMTNPPHILISRASTNSNEDSSSTYDSSESSSTTTYTVVAGTEPTIQTTTGPVNPVATFYSGAPAPTGAVMAVAGISNTIGGAGGILAEEGNNAAIDLATVNSVGNQPVTAAIIDFAGTIDFKIKTGAVATEQGGDAMLGINWGRWASNDISIKENGADVTLLTGLAFVYSPNPTSMTALGGFSSANTYNFSAGPSIRDETGAIVTAVGNFSIGVDFSAGGSITSFGGTLSGNSRTYNVSIMGQAVPFSLLLGGGDIPISSTCSGCPGGVTSLTGNAGGTFVGPGAEALIGYFGLNDTGGTVGISGAGVFTATTPPM